MRLNAPDRRPLGAVLDFRAWLLVVLGIVGTIVVGTELLVSTGPATHRLAGAAMAVVGVLLAAWLVRYVLKPVRADARPRKSYQRLRDLGRIQPTPPPAPPGSDAARWHTAIRRANDVRARRSSPARPFEDGDDA